MILQVSVIGIIAVGVTQVIITGGIDLSSGSVVGMTAMIAASFAQIVRLCPRASIPSLTDLPVDRAGRWSAWLIGLARRPHQRRADRLHRHPALHRHARHDGDRPAASPNGTPRASRSPVSTDSFAAIGSGIWPVVIFLVVALIFHIALRYTRYGKFTYAIGANLQAARVSGINVGAPSDQGLRHRRPARRPRRHRHRGPRARPAQAGMGVMYELDAIAAAVIGGTSLAGGVGRITGTVIGTIILGVMTSGFTFLRVDAYYQEIVKGMIIVAAVVADVYRQKKRTKKT